MKKIFFVFNMILIPVICAADIWYLTYGSLWRKGVTSGLFVLLGLVNLICAVIVKSAEMKFSASMLVGLIFAFAGDIVLQIDFIGGAILFAIGHIIYFVSYCFLMRLQCRDLLIGAAIFIPSAIFLLTPIFDYGSTLMEIICIVYAIIISCMVGKATSNFIREKSSCSIILMIGSIMFYFSDLMLVLNVFAHLPRIADTLCILTYYPAQALLAYSVFLSAGKKNG